MFVNSLKSDGDESGTVQRHVLREPLWALLILIVHQQQREKFRPCDVTASALSSSSTKRINSRLATTELTSASVVLVIAFTEPT